MSDEVVIRHCAPTMARIKTGSLFTSRFQTQEEMRGSLRNLNRRIRSKGMMAIPLRYRSGVGLIYLYRPALLDADLKREESSRLLSEFGYQDGSAASCLRRLALRLAEEGDFPHEIGLFLSYPPEDVDGFIRSPGDAKYTGAWKVYGDVAAARSIFARYKRCTEGCMRRWQQGWSIEQLTAAG